MEKNCSKLILIFSVLAVLLFAGLVFAKTDLSITESDISFSKDDALEGETIRIFARVFNTGDTDVYGYVIFTSNAKELADPQPVSVRANNYDDVFVDYKLDAGAHNIEAKITGENPTDENLENNKASKKEYFVDSDTDKDGTGNKKDTDDDNDGLADEQEAALGTDPLVADTDGDQAKDNADAFPRDKSEWQDTDKDGLGDNMDLDDDNDGIFDFEEEFDYGTNPLSVDTDSDGLKDLEEVNAGTNPIDADTDRDGKNDLEDKYPLDPSKWQASLLGSVIGFFNGNKYLYFLLVIPVLFIFWLLFRRRRRR